LLENDLLNFEIRFSQDHQESRWKVRIFALRVVGRMQDVNRRYRNYFKHFYFLWQGNGVANFQGVIYNSCTSK